MSEGLIYLPGWQSSHWLIPLFMASDPIEHERHDVSPVVTPTLPSGQNSHSGLAAIAVNFPVAQSVHVEEASAGADVPGWQDLQVVAPASAYLPGMQGSQLISLWLSSGENMAGKHEFHNTSSFIARRTLSTLREH